MSDLPIVDEAVLADLRSLNPDDGDAFLRELIGIYLADVPARVAELKEALSQGDRPGAVRAAHTIKGSSANVGTARIRAAAEKLEHAGRETGAVDFGPLLAELDREFDAGRRELEKRMG